MKLLLTTLLCLFLIGCSAPNEAPPAEAIPLSREMTDSLQAQYGSVVEAVSLPVENIQLIFSTGEGFLLQSENVLILLSENFQTIASLSLDFVPEISFSKDRISAFDLHSQQLLLLDLSLQEIRQLSLPSNCSGNPVLSGNSIYYCTDSSIYCWDLEHDIRRRIREAVYDNQTLIASHWEDTVLQCRVQEDDRQRDLFLDAQTGQVLQELETTAQLATYENHFYCIFPSGSADNLIFGKDPENPMGFFPESFRTQCIFLPERHTAVTWEDSVLTCYDLETGLLQDTLALHHIPKAILGQQDRILLLISHQGQDFLLQWHPQKTSPNSSVFTDLWYTADNPDHAGLSRCRDYAQKLSETYGVQILIWKDAAALSPWDYTFTPEHRYPVLLAQLQLLEHCLERYPPEILSQTSAHFDTLKICLVQSITGTAGDNSLSTATGIHFLNNGDSYVALATGAYLEQALYHELFHAMETHIFSHSNALDQWNQLNPAGFSYDLDHGTNSQRNSGVYLEGSHRSFVDIYSMSFPKEDRARIFEYAMLPDMDHIFQSKTMQRKLSAICTGIREAYGLKNPEHPLIWERYLQ